MPNPQTPTAHGRKKAAAFAALLLTCCVHAAVGAAAGVIRGRVVFTGTGSGVPGASVSLDGAPPSAVSDLNGNYVLDDVPEGSHTVSATHPDYAPVRVTDVSVHDGSVTTIPIPLESTDEVVELEAFTTSAKAAAGSGLALMGEREKAAAISDAMGDATISRFGSSDAASALGRMAASSVIDGKYVVIRGLGDRYSNTLLNGSVVPSADPDHRAVQMDQFPAAVLESIVTSKSFTADQPGGFAGGSVNLRTKTFPDGFFLSASTTVAFDSEATGQDVLAVPGGSRDWLGMDDGTRALPQGIPDRIPTQTEARLAARSGNFEPAEELDRVSRLFDNRTYFPHSEKAGPNHGFNISTGNRFELGGGRRLGYVLSLTYDQSTEHYEDGYAARYSQGSSDPASASFVDGLLVYSPDPDALSFGPMLEQGVDIPGGTPALGVTQTESNVDWGGYVQVAFMPSGDHELTLRYLHNQSASDEVKRGVGESTRSDAGRLFQNYGLLYTERALDSIQLAGTTHIANWHDVRIEWRASTSWNTQDQPDYRTLSYFWDFINEQYASAAGVGNNRVFRNIDEDNDELGLDIIVPQQLFGRAATLKLGGNWQQGGREYRERRFRWSREANQTQLIENYPNPVGITSRTSNSVTFGNTISELSSRLLNYDGEQSIRAAYAMADFSPAEQWRAIVGLRAEGTRINTAGATEGVDFQAADIDQVDYLPALSLVRTLGERMNLRLAYGRTIARPLYREVADVRVDDFFRDTYFIGNPALEVSRIDNFDVRWEWFPGGGEILAASAFYKNFTSPIEILLDGRNGAEQPRNLDKGRVFGIELEARLQLERLAPILAPFSIGGNLSLMQSRVSIPEDELAVTRQVFPDASAHRELFGQSPYIFNLDLGYSNNPTGTDVVLAYNVVGKRLFLVSADALPEIYERPAPQLDLLLSQRLGTRWRLKLAARNLLGSTNEKSFTHAGVDYFYERYDRARTFSCGLTYLFQ